MYGTVVSGFGQAVAQFKGAEHDATDPSVGAGCQLGPGGGESDGCHRCAVEVVGVHRGLSWVVDIAVEYQQFITSSAKDVPQCATDGGLEFVVGRSAGPPVESELAQIYERGGNVPLERQHQGEPTDRRLADDTSPGDQHRAAGSRCECRRDFVRSGGRERRPLSHRASIRSGVNKGGQPPTCTRGRLSGSGTARRSISWVRGGTSPSPANKNRSAFCPGALSDHSK